MNFKRWKEMEIIEAIHRRIRETCKEFTTLKIRTSPFSNIWKVKCLEFAKMYQNFRVYKKHKNKIKMSFRDFFLLLQFGENCEKRKKKVFAFSTYLFALTDVIIYFVIHIIISSVIIYIIYLMNILFKKLVICSNTAMHWTWPL